MVILANVPSAYLLTHREQEAVDAINEAMLQLTGFAFGPEERLQSVVREKTVAVEATYVLVQEDGQQRTWTGSRHRNRNRRNMLSQFEPLLTKHQLVVLLRQFADPVTIEEVMNENQVEIDTKWSFDGLISLVLNIQLTGVFPPQYRQARKIFLD